MIPKSLSASSLQVFEMCPDRWHSEYVDRAKGYSNDAADTGTAVHGGLEKYVEAVYVKGTHAHLDAAQRMELLKTLYQMSYIQTFNTPDMDTDTFRDGWNLTLKWFKRHDLDSGNIQSVESVELKETINIPVKMPDGSDFTIPFNYIMDRVDQIGPTAWRVVDYKTIRVPLDPEDLVHKIQARAYALAIQIKHPEATQIIVVFDQLRHAEVGMAFTKEDNINFWRFLVARTQEIVDLKAEDIRPRLNPECGYCIKKFTCPVMQTNMAVGGTHSLSIDEKAYMLEDVKNRIKALNGIKNELQESVLIYAAQNDTLTFDVAKGGVRGSVDIGAPKARNFDAQRAAEIMGPELFAKLGKLNLGELDKIIADESLDAGMRADLKNIIREGVGSLRVSLKPKKDPF